MNLNQPTLMQFENIRKQNKFIPPEKSNSFYNIGNGMINLFCKRSDPEDCRFDLFTKEGHIYTGVGNFIISGDIQDSDHPYENLTIIENTKLSINHMLTISKGNMEIHGAIELTPPAQLIIKDEAHVTIYTDGSLVINESTNIIVEPGSSLVIYGSIDVHISRVDSILNVKGITIDSASVMNVEGINLPNRPYSLTDYNSTLMEKIINAYTQSEKNFNDCRIGYTWTAGDREIKSQIIRLSVLWGSTILGDFKLSILGIPKENIPNLQMISDLHICKNTKLYLTEDYKNSKYLHPELYIGIVIGNNETPGRCDIDGELIADGKNACITVDRGASIHIHESGILSLKHDSIMRSTHNEKDQVLFIDGTLIIESIDQICTFTKENIVFGEKGKVIILNPDPGEPKILFHTPNGIHNSDLYKLFEDTIQHIEFHISNNTGIAIDQYYKFYGREMTNWYGGMRIEKAIHEGLLVWHDGGFIELNHEIIPWVNKECTLLHASRIFKTFGSFDKDRLQDAVNRLRYAGSGNIIFRFIDKDHIHEITLVLDDIHMKNVLNHPLSGMYTLFTDNDGKLFLKNKVTNMNDENIVHQNSTSYNIDSKKIEFFI